MEQEDTQKGKFLNFSIGSEMYGIEVRNVIEIIRILPMTEVPELPEYIKGIINLRGKIIPVMDVRLRFKKPFKEYNDKTCIIVIDIEDTYIGLIVDSVSEIVWIPEVEIVDLPELNKAGNRYIKGIGKVGNGVRLILDCYKLLTHSDFENLNSSVFKS
ncbi:chemotaxis protein CheW [Anaerocolumna sedimenticola]|uniref:Chemotaxis protein CheW n=2 Tax=Anaerocolumna sedimenticola TaxID=2696063 RepID=A0A6P1TUA1_9FIRM|nr:chemotaxis protein CheW [Anaerocolumna sedimenticola]QHQ63872.1 chemotaxis protein CheW [Anaerocolumna sedimenticola]